MSLIWALILEIPGWASLNAVYLHWMTKKTPSAVRSTAACTLRRQLSQHRTWPVTAMPSRVLQHVFNIAQQRSVASGEKTASKTPEKAGFWGRKPRGNRVTHYWKFDSDRFLPSPFLIMRHQNSHKDVLMPQESPKNIHTQHWEEALACLPHTSQVVSSVSAIFSLWNVRSGFLYE